MNKCVTCRMWERFPPSPIGEDDEGRCWLLTHDERRNGPEKRPQPKAYFDGRMSPGAVEFVVTTEEDFGCVQWEAKP